MGKNRKLQFVWPKDGPKGHSGHRGFFGRFNDILTGKGPDVFIQKQGSRQPITPDFWGNWDSYHDIRCHDMEERVNYANGLFGASRGFKRYDPQTRKYVTWSTPHDWDGIGTAGLGVGTNGMGYPRFTAEEARTMRRRVAREKQIKPHRMGADWYHDGPRRFTAEHDWFWQEAHRRGENRREGLHPLNGINPNFRMHQQWPDDLNDWLEWEGII